MHIEPFVAHIIVAQENVHCNLKQKIALSFGLAFFQRRNVDGKERSYGPFTLPVIVSTASTLASPMTLQAIHCKIGLQSQIDLERQHRH